MVRLQLHLTDDQDKALRKLAKQRRTTRAELIRRGVDILLAQVRGEVRDPILDLIGDLKLGDPNGSATVDEWLYGEPLLRRKLPRVAEPNPRLRKR